jgi:hypothetical protein
MSVRTAKCRITLAQCDVLHVADEHTRPATSAAEYRLEEQLCLGAAYAVVAPVRCVSRNISPSSQTDASILSLECPSDRTGCSVQSVNGSGRLLATECVQACLSADLPLLNFINVAVCSVEL